MAGYHPFMKAKLLSCLTLILAFIPSGLWADQLEMQNGDRLSGTVLTVSASAVLFESEMLGKINVPRKNILAVTFGANTAPAKTTSRVRQSAAPAKLPAPVPLSPLPGTKAVPAASFGSPDLDTNVIRQVRKQMLAGNPAAAAKFDELANGLVSGKLNLDDLRREARTAADQLRELKRQDPEVGDSLDAYLQILDSFLNEPADESADTPSPVQAKTQAH
jgi:hypothetical protein